MVEILSNPWSNRLQKNPPPTKIHQYPNFLKPNTSHKYSRNPIRF